MKKVKIMNLFLSILFLAACSKNDAPSNSSTTEPTEIAIESSIPEVLEPTTTFENGILTTPEFELKIKSSKIIKSPAEDNFGLYVEYELTNFLTSTIIPIEIAEKNLLFQQITDSSIVDLSNRYHFLDAFGNSDDVNSYNEQVKIDNDSWNELLPSKTVTFFEAYEIIDDSKEVEISVLIDGEKFDSYKINLNDLEKVTIENEMAIEPEQVFEEAPIVNNEADVNARFHEAIAKGMSEVDAYNHANGTNLTEAEYYGYDDDYDAVDEAQQFAEDFEDEHGRKPSSGETQLEWLEINGLLE